MRDTTILNTTMPRMSTALMLMKAMYTELRDLFEAKCFDSRMRLQISLRKFSTNTLVGIP